MLQLQTIGGSNRGTHLAKMLSILDSRKHVLRQSQHGDPVKDDDGKDVEMPYGAALYAQLFNMSPVSYTHLLRYSISAVQRQAQSNLRNPK